MNMKKPTFKEKREALIAILSETIAQIMNSKASDFKKFDCPHEAMTFFIDKAVTRLEKLDEMAEGDL